MLNKKLLLAGAAMAVIVSSTSSVEAKERMTVHEINNFVVKLTNAVNNPDPAVGRTFLARYLDENATSSNTIAHGWTHPNMRHPVWHEYYASSYYRYPNAYDPYFKPTSVRSMDKTEMIAQFESKKHMIPRYNQKIDILGTRMPAHGETAVVNVDLKEFGLGYRHAYHPYQPNYAGQVLHTAANCQLYIEKDRGEIRLNRMSCNTTMNPVF